MTNVNRSTAYTNLEICRGIPILLLLSITLLYSTLGNAATLFYSGDYDLRTFDGLSNENDALVYGRPYGAATYQNFVVPRDNSWQVAGLSTNNYMIGLAPRTAYWEIRRGISEGNGGTTIASGTATDTLSGVVGGVPGVYENRVSVNVALDPGTYWFAVVPQAPGQNSRSFNVNTFGSNSIGTQIRDRQYFNSPYFGYNFTNADNLGPYPSFSAHVYGAYGANSFDGNPIPEPSSLIMLGSGMMAAAAGVRRYLSAKLYRSCTQLMW